jgi:hypothetical protein
LTINSGHPTTISSLWGASAVRERNGRLGFTNGWLRISSLLSPNANIALHTLRSAMGPEPATATLPLRSRWKASPFWIILLLVSGRTDHDPTPRQAQWKVASGATAAALASPTQIRLYSRRRAVRNSTHRAGIPRHSENRRHFRRLAARGPVARDIGYFVRNARNSEAGLCSMNCQYQKFRNGTAQDRLRFGGDRFEQRLDAAVVRKVATWRWPAVSGLRERFGPSENEVRVWLGRATSR